MDPFNGISNSAGKSSRRQFIRNCSAGAIALTCGSLTSCLTLKSGHTPSGKASRIVPFNQNWLFGGKLNAAMPGAAIDDASFAPVTLPHCAVNLSWREWNPADWQDVWIYRKHFTLPKDIAGMRIFLHFDGVMVGATPVINGHALPPHLGGYLPFSYEITEWIRNENTLTVMVDARWSNVPPQGAPAGAKRIDYLEPGGIHRSVRLEAVPTIFISDVFAKPVQVLEPSRRIDVNCTLDAAALPEGPVQLKAEIRNGQRIVATVQQAMTIEKKGRIEAALVLSNLKDVTLWDVDNPFLYDVTVTLLVNGKPLHDYHTRIGLREARFEKDGFFLNGRRLQLFGLNRHEIFPYVGFALPDRVMRHDAEMLKKEFNCNIVRCSHYPQTEAFLNACDELGLLVWEEIPGWNYIGNDPWKELVVRDVQDMIIRDRNHPSIIIWGTRVNESPNEVELYKRTRALARSLDDSRPSSGSMTAHSTRNWEEDVFAFDDYHADPDGSVGIREPLEGVPYMLAEAVGQFNYAEKKGFNCMYRRDAAPRIQQLQALYHAQAHNKAADSPRNCGVIGWCAFEYSSLVNSYKAIKNPGVADVFRIPKIGASFYQSQGNPEVAPAIHPNFYWDFGPASPTGPGKQAAIFSNCERLEVFIDQHHFASLLPDRKNYLHLKHPPFFIDLEMDGNKRPELRIDGFVGNQLRLSRSFSSNPEQDQLLLAADDKELMGDGSDATRVVFFIADKYGAHRPFAEGKIDFAIDGPGDMIGINPFDLKESGGAGAIWVKTKAGKSGHITIKATHPHFGTKTVSISVNSI